MRLSLNEIEVTARKAALGSGFPLGLAEDAGAAAAWLAASGFPVAELMAAALEGGGAEPRLEANGARIRFVTDRGPCSVLRLGPSLCDLVLAMSEPGRRVETEAELDVPMIEVAHAALASVDSGQPLSIEIAGKAAALLVPSAPVLLVPPAELAALRGERVRIRIAMGTDLEEPPGAIRVETRAAFREGVSVPAKLWERVRDLADRTLVPATAHSHERGAGAGLIDTD